MKRNSSEFPIKTIAEIILSHESNREAQKEQVILENLDSSVTCLSHFPAVPRVVKDRYAFSKYVIDPNKYRFRKVVRILAWVILFVKNCYRKVGKQLTQISDGPLCGDSTAFMHPKGEYVVTHSQNTKSYLKCKNSLVVEMTTNLIDEALRYFFTKATNEVKHFLPVSAYRKFSEEKNDILYYTGRILPTQRPGGNLTL